MPSATTRTYGEQLELAARVTEPAIRQAIEAVDLPQGSHGLDAGCGIGTHALWLAGVTGGKVTGLDISGDNLAVARKKADKNPLADRIDLVEGSIFDLPFEENSFDWAWCSDTLYPVVVPEYQRVCNPESEDFVLNNPDYYCNLSYTIFHARVPGK